MPPRYVPQSAHAARVLLLLLTALLAGATLGRLLLPPGRLGPGEDLGIPGARVQAVAAARSSSPNSPAVRPAIGREQSRGDLPSVTPSTFSTGPRMGNLTGGAHRLPGGPMLEQEPDWRLELQVSLSWQYAGGTSSRALHAPVSPPIGEPLESAQ